MAWPSEDELKKIYAETKTIAVVGASTDEFKAAHRIPRYLQSQGYKIIPINPTTEEILGETTFGELSEVTEPIDAVDVFRPAEEAPDIARQAIEKGAKVLWLQEGIASEEARKIAEDAGLTVVMDLCMGTTHGRLGLGPGP
jgi:predicted CoA-binding protein